MIKHSVQVVTCHFVPAPHRTMKVCAILAITAAVCAAATPKTWPVLVQELKNACKDNPSGYCLMVTADTTAINFESLVQKVSQAAGDRKKFIADPIKDFGKRLKGLYKADAKPDKNDPLTSFKIELSEMGAQIVGGIEKDKAPQEVARWTVQVIAKLLSKAKEKPSASLLVEFLHPIDKCLERMESVHHGMKSENSTTTLLDESSVKDVDKLKEARLKAFEKVTPVFRRPGTIAMIAVSFIAVFAVFVAGYLVFSRR